MEQKRAQQPRLPSQISKPIPSGRTPKQIAEECLRELKKEKNQEGTRKLLEATWTELCENKHDTFYIESPLSKEAKQLRNIAKKFADNSSLQGNTYQLLMPTVQNNSCVISGDDLPEETNQLILTDPDSKGNRHLLVLSELIENSEKVGRKVLINPFSADVGLHQRGLTEKELTQIGKAPDHLRKKVKNLMTTGEAWLSPQTLRVLTFVLNITLSEYAEPDADLEEKFKTALAKNDHFRLFAEKMQKQMKEHSEFIEIADEKDERIEEEQTLQLSTAFLYFDEYISSLPEDEKRAFKQLTNNAGLNVYDLLQMPLFQSACSSEISIDLASFVYEASAPEQKLSTNFQLHAEKQRWTAGRKTSLVKPSSEIYSSACKAYDPEKNIKLSVSPPLAASSPTTSLNPKPTVPDPKTTKSVPRESRDSASLAASPVGYPTAGLKKENPAPPKSSRPPNGSFVTASVGHSESSSSGVDDQDGVIDLGGAYYGNDDRDVRTGYAGFSARSPVSKANPDPTQQGVDAAALKTGHSENRGESKRQSFANLIQSSIPEEFKKFLNTEALVWNFTEDRDHAFAALQKLFLQNTGEDSEPSFYQEYDAVDALKLFHLAKSLYIELETDADKQKFFKIILSALSETLSDEEALKKACLGYQVFLKEFESELQKPENKEAREKFANQLSAFVQANSKLGLDQNVRLQTAINIFTTGATQEEKHLTPPSTLTVKKKKPSPFVSALNLFFRPIQFAETFFPGSTGAKIAIALLNLVFWVALFTVFPPATIPASLSIKILDFSYSQTFFLLLTLATNALIQLVQTLLFAYRPNTSVTPAVEQNPAVAAAVKPTLLQVLEESLPNAYRLEEGMLKEKESLSGDLRSNPSGPLRSPTPVTVASSVSQVASGQPPHSKPAASSGSHFSYGAMGEAMKKGDNKEDITSAAASVSKAQPSDSASIASQVLSNGNGVPSSGSAAKEGNDSKGNARKSARGASSLQPNDSKKLVAEAWGRDPMNRRAGIEGGIGADRRQAPASAPSGHSSFGYSREGRESPAMSAAGSATPWLDNFDGHKFQKRSRPRQSKG